jgi:hypothetical protein
MKVLNYLMKIGFMQSGGLKAAEFPTAYIVFLAVRRLRQGGDVLRLPAHEMENITR